MRLEGWHLLIILAIVLLLFGAPRLPALARSIGQSMKIFRTEIKQPQADDEASAAQSGAAAPDRSSSSDAPLPAVPTPTTAADDEAASRRTS